jgi:hypothetical protein
MKNEKEIRKEQEDSLKRMQADGLIKSYKILSVLVSGNRALVETQLTFHTSPEEVKL